MFDLRTYLLGLAVIVALALATWVVSLFKRDVSIVDSMWSILFLAATIVYVAQSDVPSPRARLLLLLVAAWALRLAIYLAARNWGQPEDRRYQKIRGRNQPNFAFKSVYIVFLLQGLLAWIISLPLLAASASPAALTWLDYAGAAIAIVGLVFEAVGDWQLSRFRSDPTNSDKVMNQGLWRYTRHPNYFGDCGVWWGFYLLALSAGGWWSAVGPLLMNVLLIRVSGVALLERDIAKRRPEYRGYMETTNALFPGPKRTR
jgi:steroid 5-alpha reductase family enzyme